MQILTQEAVAKFQMQKLSILNTELDVNATQEWVCIRFKPTNYQHDYSCGVKTKRATKYTQPDRTLFFLIFAYL